MYSNFYDYCCEIRDRKDSKVPKKPRYRTLENFENKHIQSGCQKIIKDDFISIISNLNLNEDEYLFDIFDIDRLNFEAELDVSSRYKTQKTKNMYYIDFSALYYSESMNKFLYKKCRVWIMGFISEGSISWLKHCLYKIYNDEFNKSMRKYLNYTEDLNKISKQCIQGIFNSIRNELIGKPMSALIKELNSSHKIVYKYGLSNNFTKVNVEFGGGGKYFDYIRVEGYISGDNTLEFVKCNKNKILKMYLDSIMNTRRWKNLDIPINVLKLTDLILTRSNILVATFSVKETSQS